MIHTKTANLSSTTKHGLAVTATRTFAALLLKQFSIIFARNAIAILPLRCYTTSHDNPLSDADVTDSVVVVVGLHEPLCVLAEGVVHALHEAH